MKKKHGDLPTGPFLKSVKNATAAFPIVQEYYKYIINTMSAKSRGNKNNFKVTLDTAALSKFHQSYNLLGYTALTFFLVLLLYIATKDWKGYTSPEEVDLGAVQVPSHTCRRKHTHLRRH